ncbi:sensor domain-containing diguanylate cyclase [Clostridium sp. ZS2-4]|uniref:sensor domain-containing diguanylate cyclase n=1 Tax=Clostridium sp. ZS2-4 TaxID=2987703 RepID=UPI00227B2BF9|nr:diguanylate cyclase [Clostridium sp. ZS2-4]MCY6354279.1 GGDEF domain-containing protein [Clostridium sp. ZS2-4]
MEYKVKNICVIVIILFSMLLLCSDIFLNETTLNFPKAEKGEINLTQWDFQNNGIVCLNGQWELYFNELLQLEDIKYKKTKQYFNIPGELIEQLDGKSQGYMTLRLKISLPDNKNVYGLRIDSMLTASKVWVNGVLQGSHGKVGKNKKEEKAIYLPVYAYFTPVNGIVDIVIQTSTYRDIEPIIREMYFGTKKQIMNICFKNTIMDVLVIGSLLIMGLHYLVLYLLRRKERSCFYFSILCLLIQLRIFILNERILVRIYPDMPYEVLSKIAAITYYLWTVVYILFLKEQFEDLSDKIVKVTIAFGTIFTVICLFTSSRIYDDLGIKSQVILVFILIYLLFFLIKKASKGNNKAQMSLLSFVILLITGVNDILVNDNMINNMYVFHIGMFIFALLEAYVLAVSYSNNFHNLEQLVIENKKNYQRSIRDSLTNLYNHSYIENVLISAVDRFNKTEEIFSVLMIDIDYFKNLNDKYGHPFGDEVLVNLSKLFKENVRNSDFAGRYGGEEFLIILPNTNIKDAEKIAERIRKEVQESSWSRENIEVTISIGVYQNRKFTKQECIETVDNLLYLAKHNGRNRIEKML